MGFFDGHSLLNDLQDPRNPLHNAGLPPGAVAPGGGAGRPGVITGADPSNYNPASGGIPNLTDPGVSMMNLLKSISGALPQLNDIISGVTGASSKALNDQFSPGFHNLLATTTATANRRAAGDVSDLIPDLAQTAAEMGISSGLSGSPAASTKFLRDLGLTKYGVEKGALDDLGKIRGATPTVAPYGAENVIPNINVQTTLQQLADIMKAAGIPEAVYNRTLGNIKNGLGAGRGAVGGFPGGGGTGNVDSMLSRYGGGGGSAGPGGVPNPTTPGWGYVPQDPWASYFNDEWNAMQPDGQGGDPFQDMFDDEWAAGHSVAGGGVGGAPMDDEEWYF